jgi:hypothetical protein
LDPWAYQRGVIPVQVGLHVDFMQRGGCDGFVAAIGDEFEPSFTCTVAVAASLRSRTGVGLFVITNGLFCGPAKKNGLSAQMAPLMVVQAAVHDVFNDVRPVVFNEFEQVPKRRKLIIKPVRVVIDYDVEGAVVDRL